MKDVNNGALYRYFHRIFTHRARPRSAITLLLLVCFILSVFSAAFLIDPAGVHAQQTTPRRATIASMAGSVLVQSAGQAVALPARKNMEIKAGDRIITGKDGTAELKYDDGSISRIGPNSRVDIADLSRQSKDGTETTVLNAQRGSLWNNTKEVVQRNSRFEVNTPSAVAGVRGTNFMVRVDNARDTLVRVYSGQVGVAPTGGAEPEAGLPGEIFVDPFQQAGFDAGEPPPGAPAPLDPLDVDDFEKDNLVEDQPAAYIEVETEAKTLMLTQAEEKLQEELHNLAVLAKELELLAAKLATETDPAKIAQLKSLQQQLQTEQQSRQEIVKNLDQDRLALARERESLAELKEKLDEFTPAQLKEQAQAARAAEKARAAERAAREQERAEREKAAAAALLQAAEQAAQLGLAAELEQAGESVTEKDIREAGAGILPPEQPAVGDDYHTPPPPAYYTLTLTVNNTEAGTVEGGGSYTAGTTINLIASPKEGYRFEHWSVNGGGAIADINAARTDFTMPAGNVTIIARFERITLQTYELVLNASPAEGGTVTGGGSYTAGDAILISANPAEGCQFTGWRITAGGGTIKNENERETTFTMPSQAVTIEAIFIQLPAVETGCVSGAVKDESGFPLPEVTVTIVKGAFSQKVSTSEDGSYLLSDIPADGVYDIVFAKEGYQQETYYNIGVDPNSTTYLVTVYLQTEFKIEPGNISGYIIDALTDHGINGLTVIFRPGINATTGEPLVKTQTGYNNDESGFYFLSDLAPGTYTGEISAEEYITTFFTVVVISGETNDDQNASISPRLSEGETRAVLTWGEYPRDLDFHLTGPTPDGSLFHVYYGNKQYPYDEGQGPVVYAQSYEAPKPYAVLDVDDTDSYGPETITINNQIDGVYTFFVYNWSKDGKLTASGAQIKVYRGTGNAPVKVFNVPTEDEGYYWIAFELEGEDIISINSILTDYDFAEGGNIEEESFWEPAGDLFFAGKISPIP